MATLASPYGGRGGGQAIAGAWFPSGFHGHSRTGRRNDFLNEFRMRARPQPPVIFLQRFMEKPEAHVFSLHDNREAYLRPEQSCAKRELSEKGIQPRLFDGEFFDLGLGKRKIANSSQRSDNRMFWWTPQKVDYEAPGPNPSISSYKSNFSAQKEPSQVYVEDATDGQARANTPAIQTKERFTTMYRYTFNKDPRSNGVINVMNNGALVQQPPHSAPAVTMGKKRVQACTDSVRSCLVWTPAPKQPETKQQSPPVYTPAPPTTPKPATVHPTNTTTTTPKPLPQAGFCDDYGPKPLVFAPNRGNTVSDTPYTNEAQMAAAAYKNRSSQVFGPPSTTTTTVKFADEPPLRPQTTVQNEGGLSRSKSEADISRPKSTTSIVFTTRLW